MPPQPGMFKALAFVGMLMGCFGLVGSLQHLASEARPRPRQDDAEPGDSTGQIQRIALHVGERHRETSIGLVIANGILSSLLLISTVATRGRREWGRTLMIQAAVACGLYELPAVAHDARQHYEMLQALQPLTPQLLGVRAAPTGFLALGMATGAALLGAVALLKVSFYFLAVRYLRRPDVCSWFRGEGVTRT